LLAYPSPDFPGRKDNAVIMRKTLIPEMGNENQYLFGQQTLKTRFMPQRAKRQDLASARKAAHDLPDQC
jgi:hypothetical protein